MIENELQNDASDDDSFQFDLQLVPIFVSVTDIRVNIKG